MKNRSINNSGVVKPFSLLDKLNPPHKHPRKGLNQSCSSGHYLPRKQVKSRRVGLAIKSDGLGQMNRLHLFALSAGAEKTITTPLLAIAPKRQVETTAATAARQAASKAGTVATGYTPCGYGCMSKNCVDIVCKWCYTCSCRTRQAGHHNTTTPPQAKNTNGRKETQDEHEHESNRTGESQHHH